MLYELELNGSMYAQGCYETLPYDYARPSLFLDAFDDFSYGLYLFEKKSVYTKKAKKESKKNKQ